jgi:hypothetical protein
MIAIIAKKQAPAFLISKHNSYIIKNLKKYLTFFEYYIFNAQEPNVKLMQILYYLLLRLQKLLHHNCKKITFEELRYSHNIAKATCHMLAVFM